MTTKWTKEKQSEYYKKWRQRNKENIKSYQKKWHEENKEHVQQYLKDNAESIRLVQKRYRETHKEEIKTMWREWYEEHPERSPKRRFTESKNKATKKRGINWTLTFDQYAALIEMPCYYCENKLGEPVKRSCGLDRLDSNKGYEMGNVVSCCYICNTIKNEHLTVEETKAAVGAILKVRQNKLST
jgi:hypothetical protein